MPGGKVDLVSGIKSHNVVFFGSVSVERGSRKKSQIRGENPKIEQSGSNVYFGRVAFL